MDLKHVTVASVRVDPMKLIVLNESFRLLGCPGKDPEPN